MVALEEKLLQVRSREIRLEKETKGLQGGVDQAERQLQTSRQDRASLQATIDMLQVQASAKIWCKISTTTCSLVSSGGECLTRHHRHLLWHCTRCEAFTVVVGLLCVNRQQQNLKQR